MFQKFEFEEMRDHLLGKLEKIHKCKSKLVKVFGIYWFQEMSPEEWANKKDAVITLVKEEIHSEQQLNEFMARVNRIREPMDNVQYRMYLIPDYKDGESVFILKAHHVLSDGLGCSSMGLALSDNYDKNALPALKPLSLCKNFMIHLCLPYLYLKATLSMLFTFRDENVIKKCLPNTGVKEGACA